jgi:hypothetical protein
MPQALKVRHDSPSPLLPHSLQVTSSSEVSTAQEIISDVLSSAMLS